jgi:hypothetical protein
MKKISRKAIRPKKARTRTDHPAGCRVNENELAMIRQDIDDIAAASGIKPSLGSYVKDSLLKRPRYRKLEVGLRKLLADEAIDSYFAGEEPATNPVAGLDFYNGVKALLEGL